MRALILLVLAIAPAYPAEAGAAPPAMTGERLVKLMGNVDPASVDWREDSPFRSRAIAAEYMDLANGEFVRGYIQAVYDAAEGKGWCWDGRYRPKLHELESDARHTLQRMPTVQLKRNAADLIVEVWKKMWPCPVRRGSAP